MRDDRGCFYISFQFQTTILFFHFLIVLISWQYYLTAKEHSKIFIETTCQINQTLTTNIHCSIRQNNTKVKKLCTTTYYGIIYGNNLFTFFDQLPSWFSPIDLKNLNKNSMIFLRKPLFKPINITCYYNRLNHMELRWTQPDPKTFIQIILFSFFSLCLILIHCFDECYRHRRSNR
ncbi:unnamed protein product [Rotaria sordida]|uniref:Uncharacterized protein n=1 Tax=Rotaria sordida TaxID=392033 RepID=A0A814GQS7_9BILA|nr:unnamed protein product [Rotaria sordida]CAF1399244.1 unnamed protein product [Rotaria sordida]CAF3669846.1 unnamed protein product [Rotaria sordida]CAF4000163.1 unnamed protein product [Rotaria sordida]